MNKDDDINYLYRYAYIDYDGNINLSSYMDEENFNRLLKNKTKTCRIDFSRKIKEDEYKDDKLDSLNLI